jgi:hypothetical protein
VTSARALKESGILTFRAFVHWLRDMEEEAVDEPESPTDEGDDVVRIMQRHALWRSEVRNGSILNGYQVPTVALVTWLDESTPWAVFTVEEVRYGLDVSDSIRAKRP